MNQEISLIIAFSGGVISFFSACVLPLIPAYLSFISGVTFSHQEENPGTNYLGQVFSSTFLFVVGFSIIFTLLGASASLIGGFLVNNKLLLSRIGGVIIIFMGLVLAGLVKVPALHRERRFHFSERPVGLLGAIPVGMAFGLGWTPCVGPVLSSILILAAGQGAGGGGALLLSFYSLGLGIPFILSGLLFTRFLNLFNWIKKHYATINAISSGILILIGILLVTGQWQAFGAWIQGLLR